MFQVLILSLILSIQLACVHAPDKPETSFSLMQYLLKINDSSKNSNNANVNSSNPIFDLAAIFDTGQIGCWNGVGIAVIGGCPGTGHDGAFIDTPRQRSFGTPIQNNTYSSDYTTLDRLHGLVWKTCAEGLTGSNCSAGAIAPISWIDANAGLAGSCMSLNTMNGGNGYAEKTNWRIPSVKELASLINYANNPYIETSSFPNTFTGGNYLAATSDSANPAGNWSINFSVAGLSILPVAKNSPNNLRCVSGNSIPAFSFLDRGDGTIRDLNTGLLWQKCTSGLTVTACTGVSNTLDWNQAINDCNNLALDGRTWRLPNVNELLSIVDYTTPGLAIPNAFFPNTEIGLYWTSTTFDNVKSSAHLIDFTTGSLGTNDKSSFLFTRCVTTY
ncbi:DUF1566 domain-containing protein [Leptospira adleri]|uniref:Lcl C-terminal domain-containing protein n=1 Tax=Leptospira adleri TaxID=2023186 RepID=UPI001083EF15|nr:DUF1566 domain-containing protein [Leptospira adleri]TGM58368.1 DUF1566 domain-containing protein [Leptospira adleri]